MKTSAIHFVPKVSALSSGLLPGAAVAVIDVLRATTSITAALTAGSAGVIPCATLREARQQAAALKGRRQPVVLAGERGGVRVPGFDLGNSPDEFGPAMRGQTVVLTTSNGTRALAAVACAKVILAVCLNNLTAAARMLAQCRVKRIIVLAAGDGAGGSEEDTLTAGLLIRRLCRLQPETWRPAWNLDRMARFAYAYSAAAKTRSLKTLLAGTPHGRDLIQYGFKSDIGICARLDSTTMVGRVTPAGKIIPGPSLLS